jgi:hypothetical protein
MIWREDMLLSEIPEFMSYPTVSTFVKDHLEMQFGDVRSMLRLPLPALGITYACNFAAAAVLCHVISGISVSLFRPITPVRGSGDAFKRLLEAFYPWQSGEDGAERAIVLYDLIRNPAAHALGVHGSADYLIYIRRPRTGLEEAEIDEMERSPTRPQWLPPGLSGAGNRWDLVVDGFYRDVFHMLWRLASDHHQMSAAEKRFSAGTIIWRTRP